MWNQSTEQGFWGSVLNLIPFLEKGDEGLVPDKVIGDKVQPIPYG